MSTGLDAVATSRGIEESYLRYLRGLLPVSDPELARAISQALAEERVVRGPYLEITPPYAPGLTLRALIEEGIVHPTLSRLDRIGGVPLDRPLHHHQEQAIRRAASGRNLVVATGTGSGKTESFLLPVLDHLAREAAAGTLGSPGVRALLLYPMNALANDQLKRLRALLAGWPEVTYGRYTGETQQEHKRARQDFALRFPGIDPPGNELLSREEMQARPPHLLLTNYAMLEYLLLRPADTTLFDGSTGRHWRFIVLDEAHVYDGAAGSEVALLLRRLADRVGGGGLRAIATSATVGGEQSGPAVARFAEELFGLPFEYDEREVARQDVVWAVRQDLAVSIDSPWSGLDEAMLAELEGLDSEALGQRMRELSGQEGTTADLLRRESHILELLRLLSEGARPVVEVAAQLFPGLALDAALAASSRLVSLGAAVTDPAGIPVVPARYHLWARATEGAFACLDPSGPHVRLTRHEQCNVCSASMVEVGACKRCSATYLIGTRSTHGDEVRLLPAAQSANRTSWFLLDDQVEELTTDSVSPSIEVDEDDVVLEDLEDNVSGSAVAFCPRCGRLAPGSTAGCGCGIPSRRLIELDAQSRTLASCVRCGGRSRAGQVRRLQSGADAAVSVLATTLYQSLAPDPDPIRGGLPGGGRKLLLFADSRQEAAYFAPYLDSSYDRLLRRSTILAAIEVVDDPTEPPGLAHVAARAAKVAEENGYFPAHLGGQERRALVRTWVHAELVSVGPDQTLEGLGLVSFEVRRPSGLSIPEPLLALGLTDQESWDFVTELLRTVRGQGAVSYPDDVDPKDELFEPRVGPIRVREVGSEARKKVLSWLPTKGRNTRLDYLERLLEAVGSGGQGAISATDILGGVWRWLGSLSSGTALLAAHHDAGLGVLHHLDERFITARLVTPERPVHRCDRCQRIAPTSVRGVCPTLRCMGRLAPWSPPLTDDSHYRQVARALRPFPLRVSEHTAHLTSTEAARVQQEFLDGHLNALSCSTTFELGVDVGELEAVILRNVPPSTSNYIQRAGRAGRRSSSAALVVTYASRNSHDLTHFRDPRGMISGVIRAPRITVENERIARRHVHAIALAAYFRERAEFEGRELRRVGDLFDGAEEASLLAWLAAPPASVLEAARRVVPTALHDRVGLDDESWSKTLSELIRQIAAVHHQDVMLFQAKEQEAAAAKKYSQAKYFQRVVTTFTQRQLIGHFSSTNVLPKYGFPVDTVELRTQHVGTDESRKIELMRDLRVAIAEYAPGSEVVAAGKLWRSAGIYRLRDRDLPKYHFASCSCGWYRQSIETFNIEACPVCGASGHRAPTVRLFIQPEFGFIAASTPPKAPRARPERVYAGSVHLVEGSVEGDPTVVQLTPTTSVAIRYATRGRLALINTGPSQRGYLICEWCGFGSSVAQASTKGKDRSHPRPMTGESCTGPMEWLCLGHQFETDVLEIRAVGISAPHGAAVWWGLLYAVVEAGAEELQISRDDLDGTLNLDADGSPTLILFDDVPAGAGHVRQLAEHLPTVLESALRRVVDCECGPETSCYRCLRGFRNQRLHDDLRRGAVAELLAQLLGREPQVENWLEIEPGDPSLHVGRVVRVRTEERPDDIAGRLWEDRSEAGLVDEVSPRYLLESSAGSVQLPRGGWVVTAVRV